MDEPIRFLAILSGQSAIRFDADGGGKLTLAFDDQQTAGLVRLLTMRNRLLEVSVRVVEGYERTAAGE